MIPSNLIASDFWQKRIQETTAIFRLVNPRGDDVTLEIELRDEAGLFNQLYRINRNTIRACELLVQRVNLSIAIHAVLDEGCRHPFQRELRANALVAFPTALPMEKYSSKVYQRPSFKRWVVALRWY